MGLRASISNIRNVSETLQCHPAGPQEVHTIYSVLLLLSCEVKRRPHKSDESMWSQVKVFIQCYLQRRCCGLSGNFNAVCGEQTVRGSWILSSTQ